MYMIFPDTLPEIVLPIYDKNKQIIGVFDIDSTAFAAFDGVDAEYLTLILGDLFAK
jgi:putative methionine-R-sulfoxide reductase with GAF domain